MNIPRLVACFQQKLPTGVHLLPDYAIAAVIFAAVNFSTLNALIGQDGEKNKF